MQLSILLAATSLLLLSSPASAQGGCRSGVRQRKEVRDLSASEWQRFVAAVRRVQSGRSPNSFDRLSKMHYDNNANIHNVALFFPWHRQFLRELEILLQQQDSTIMLPYWAWSFDSQAPEASPIFSNAYYGGNGSGSGMCVQDGQFRGFQPAYPRQHCMTRNFNLGARIGAFYSVEHINRLVSTSRSYDALRQGVEMAPHGTVHVGIGSDMSTMYSPNDPIFYAHHAYIDKIWADWQAADSRRLGDYGGRNAGGSTGRLADTMAPWNYRVQDVMDTTRLCYRYQAFSRMVAVPVTTPSTPAPAPTPTPSRPAPSPPAPRPPAPRAPPPPPPSPRRPWDFIKDVFGSDDDDDDSGDDDEDNWGLVRRQTAPTDAEPAAPTEAAPTAPTEAGPSTPTAPDAPAKGPTAPEVIPAGDRTVLTGLRIPDPLPQTWCTMNRIPVEDMRKQESVFKKVCQEVNKIPGYISPASLWVREDLTEKLITPTKKFLYFDNGRPVTVTPKSGYRDRNEAFRGLKDDVRRRYGGHLRSDPRHYWNDLQRVIGDVKYPIIGVLPTGDREDSRHEGGRGDKGRHDNSHDGRRDDSLQVHRDDSYDGRQGDSRKGRQDDSYNGGHDNSHGGRQDDSYKGRDDDSRRKGRQDDSYNGGHDNSHGGRQDGSKYGGRQDDSTYKGPRDDSRYDHGDSRHGGQQYEKKHG